MITDPTADAPSDGLFRNLSRQEVQDFRAWARANYTPLEKIPGVWHPVIQSECVAMNQEAGKRWPSEDLIECQHLQEGGDA
jgi:hypothetical protein